MLEMICMAALTLMAAKYIYKDSSVERAVNGRYNEWRGSKYENTDIEEYTEEYCYMEPETESFEVEEPILIHSANKKMFITDDMVEGIYINTEEDDDTIDSGLYSDRDYNEVSK